MKLTKKQITIRSVIAVVSTALGLLVVFHDSIPVIKDLFALVSIFFGWLSTKHSVYGGLILVLSLLSILFLISATVWIVDYLNKKKIRLSDYRQDSINGVLWMWKYNPDGSLRKDSFVAFCPNENCKQRLTTTNQPVDLFPGDRWGNSSPPIYSYLICKRCRKTFAESTDSNSFAHDAYLEAERRISTGEYQKALRL